MKTGSLPIIASAVLFCVWAKSENPASEESLRSKITQHLREFADAEPGSFEHFKAAFQVRFACEQYNELYRQEESDPISDLVDSELTENASGALFEFIDRTFLWNRLPTDAELNTMIEDGEITETPPEFQISKSKRLRGTIQSADEIFVYEGYLRPWGDSDFDFKSFVHSGETVILPKRKVEPHRFAALREIFGTEKFFADWGGPKACGGFSADYMLEWDLEGAPVRIMICNGCFEIIVTWKEQWFKHDFADEKATEIKEAMANFDQKRTQMLEIMEARAAAAKAELNLKPGLSDDEKAAIRAALKREDSKSGND